MIIIPIIHYALSAALVIVVGLYFATVLATMALIGFGAYRQRLFQRDSSWLEGLEGSTAERVKHIHKLGRKLSRAGVILIILSLLNAIVREVLQKA